jgi:hypothetical protein
LRLQVTPPLPFLLAALGIVALLLGAEVLRRQPGYRVGRLLRAAPEVSIAEAVSAATGPPRFVRVRGRVTSDEEFPDEHDRPLVYRRRAIQVAVRPGRWRTVEEDREAVPFGVEERGSSIGIDSADLDEGLVVLPRMAEGRAADIPGRLPADVPPEAEVRYRIDQISAVELATVAGVPQLRDGRAILGPGLGRPLLLTTLELPAAMRVLGGGRRGMLVVASALLVSGATLLALAVIGLVVGVAGG